MILSIPWLIVAVILYNLLAFTSSWPPIDANTGHFGGPTVFQTELPALWMLSGATWTLTLGDLVILITLALLFVEIIKSTRTGETSIIDHGLSMILFVISGVEFLSVQRAATSVFFFIVVATIIDVVAGFTITIRAARRDLTLGGAN